MSLYLIIVLLLFLYTQVFLSVQFLALCFSPCILSRCLLLLTHTIMHHSFANDLQLQMCTPLMKYLSYFTLCSHVLAMSNLGQQQTCLNLMTTRQNSCLSSLRDLSISITYLLQSLSAMLKFPSKNLKNLVFTIDCHLVINAHVSNIIRTCYYELRRFAYIRRFLTSTATATLVSVFVLSRIDYCNSLLFGSTHDVSSHLQWIQNYAAQLILRLPKLSSITTHLKSLHLLPVKVRSTYEIASLCYHCFSCTAPSYVADMLQKKLSHNCNTPYCSYTMPLLTSSARIKATLGDRSFSFASSVWNSIPNDVRCAPSLSSSKSRLKTYLFLFSLQRLNFLFDHSAYVHGFALL